MLSTECMQLSHFLWYWLWSLNTVVLSLWTEKENHQNLDFVCKWTRNTLCTQSCVSCCSCRYLSAQLLMGSDVNTTLGLFFRKCNIFKEWTGCPLHPIHGRWSCFCWDAVALTSCYRAKLTGFYNGHAVQCFLFFSDFAPRCFLQFPPSNQAATNAARACARCATVITVGVKHWAEHVGGS